VFGKEVIERLVRKFQLQQKTINLNYQHLKDSQIKNAVIQEIWLTGKVDKSQTFGFDLPEGSAFVAAYIGDKDFWINEVKSGNVRGFSIEGFLDMELKKLNQNIMDQKFITAQTDKGEITSDAESFTAGGEVYTMVEGVKTPCADGDYTLDNGMVLKVEGGKITEVTEADAELTESEVEIIQKAMKPIIEGFEARIAELKVKLENIPATLSVTTPEPVKKLTSRQSLKTKLSILRKKDNEVTTTTKK
jgi:hypothetical protein